jgi:hypothetical protein
MVKLLYTTSAICIKYRLAISKNPNVNSPEQVPQHAQHSQFSTELRPVFWLLMDLSETCSTGTLPLQTVILTWVWVFWKILCPPNVPSQMSKSHNIATLYQDLHEMWILQGCLLICRIKYTFTKLQRNLHNNNSTEKTEWGHNLVSKAYKVSDHHLHHGEPW